MRLYNLLKLIFESPSINKYEWIKALRGIEYEGPPFNIDCSIDRVYNKDIEELDLDRWQFYADFTDSISGKLRHLGEDTFHLLVEYHHDWSHVEELKLIKELIEKRIKLWESLDKNPELGDKKKQQ